jgi:hypothetical protein
MNVKEAVGTAKRFIQDIFADKDITDIGLEEVEFDEQGGEWRVTIGFSRPWDKVGGIAALASPTNPRRIYKVVRISGATGKVISVKDRMTTT